MRIGKSAGGEMHLSAVVHCPRCDMFVELGTDDCPHAIELGKAHQGPVSTQLERIEQGQSVLCERLDALAKHIEEREKSGDETLKKILAIRQQEYEDLSGQNANLLTQIMLLKLEVRAKKPAKRAKKKA